MNIRLDWYKHCNKNTWFEMLKKEKFDETFLREEKDNLGFESIYDKYRSNPELKLDQQLYDILHHVVSVSRDGTNVLKMLKEIEYQLMSEKNRTAPFKLDCISLLDALSQNIKTNKDVFSKEYESLNLKNGFMPEFEEHNDFVDSICGRRFM